MPGRKKQIARVAAALGLIRLLENVPTRPSLLILNYHRIGDAAATPFDSGVYSCTADDLARHVEQIQSRFRIVGLDDAVEALLGRRVLHKSEVLLTFDDGYLDNYELAFPIFRRLGVPAAFYLTTSFVGSSDVPWWDLIAYMLKSCKRSSIEISLPFPHRVNLEPAFRERAIQHLLEIYKSAKTPDLEPFLAHLETACDCARPVPDRNKASSRVFLNWDEAREMQAAGMSFGSHTHTHRILGKLPFDEQVDELRLSRMILERELGRTIDTIAYPVGGPGSFNEDTARAVDETGYRCGFSFLAGTNLPGFVDRHSIRRTGVFSGSRAVLRLRSVRHMLTARASSHIDNTDPAPGPRNPPLSRSA